MIQYISFKAHQANITRKILIPSMNPQIPIFPRQHQYPATPYQRCTQKTCGNYWLRSLLPYPCNHSCLPRLPCIPTSLAPISAILNWSSTHLIHSFSTRKPPGSPLWIWKLVTSQHIDYYALRSPPPIHGVKTVTPPPTQDPHPDINSLSSLANTSTTVITSISVKKIISSSLSEHTPLFPYYDSDLSPSLFQQLGVNVKAFPVPINCITSHPDAGW